MEVGASQKNSTSPLVDLVVEQYQAKNATILLAVEHYSPLVVEQYQAPWVQSKLNSYAEWKPPRQPGQIQTFTTGATSSGVLHKQTRPLCNL